MSTFVFYPPRTCQMLFHLAVVVFASLATASTPKISHATVLLPNDHRAVFTLTTENGCFHFSTDRIDLLSLKAGNGECAKSVIVSKNAGYSTDSSERAIVTARDLATGAELRSEVYITSVARLELITRIRRFSVGEIEAIQVQGYDRFGNTFSSLEGLEFKWTVGDAVDVVPLHRTEDSLSPVRLGIESDGHQSDILIIVGKRPGKSMMTACEGSICSHPVGLSVVENFDIFYKSPFKRRSQDQGFFSNYGMANQESRN